jgi:hypothetical protein
LDFARKAAKAGAEAGKVGDESEIFFDQKTSSCAKALILLMKSAPKFFQKTLASKFAPDSLFVLRR